VPKFLPTGATQPQCAASNARKEETAQ